MQNGQENQIIKLRVKYNNAIQSAKINEKRNWNMQEGKKLYIEAASRKLVNLVIQSSQQSQDEKQTMEKEGNSKSANKKTVTFAKNLTSVFDEAGNKDNAEV